MNILNLFKKPEPILMRCTLCSFELPFSMREVRRLEKLNAKDPVCPIKEECHICHTGFMIPVSYINKILRSKTAEYFITRGIGCPIFIDLKWMGRRKARALIPAASCGVFQRRYKSGKTFLYDKIKPKIKNLDPDTVAQRIYEHPDMLDLDSFS